MRPKLGENVFIASTAYVGGDVTLGDSVTVMHHVTIRGDVSAIRIGKRCNVQDGTVIHTKTDVDLDIEDDVSIGHRAVVHCTRVGSGSLIGTGAIVLDGAIIGRNCLIGAAALVTPGTVIPDGMMVKGIPGKPARPVSTQERKYMQFVTERYLDLGKRHDDGEFPNIVD